MAAPFGPGQTIVLQDVYGDRVWSARPMRVVQDDGDFVALWAPKGSIRKVPTGPPSRPRLPTRAERFVASLSLRDWIHVDNEWDVDTLWLMHDGDWHATWICWRGNYDFWGWYINLQEPYQRTARGFRTMDLELDVVIYADRTWQWKDKDEFDALAAAGVFPENKARSALAEATEMLRRLEADEPPFSEPWSQWRPDPSWPAPTLSGGWDQL